MRFGWGKLVVLLVTSLGVLQVVHVLLLNWLEVKTSSGGVVGGSGPSSRSRRRGDEEMEGDEWKQSMAAISRDLRDMVATVRDSSVLDSSGEFRIINFLAPSDGLQAQKNHFQDVTLVTQCSHARLPHVLTLSRAWSGPMAVAAFATKGDLIDVLVSIAELRQCFPSVRRNTSFHLVYPLSHHREHHFQELVNIAILKWSSSSSLQTNKSCEKFLFFSSNSNNRKMEPEVSSNPPSLPANYDSKDGVPYPNNLLRNVARRNILTEFFFLVDADMIPSSQLHAHFLDFADTNRLFSDAKKDDKTVYVVPAFEAKEDVAIPGTKSALLELIESMKARPFYFELCWKCQKHTDYDAWQREAITPQLKVVFEVLWKDPWEPFYIARNSVPLYDERFKQYGFNRISQVCELHVSGYRFSVLNNAFLVHSGLKTVDSFHKKKDEDQERNRLLFRQFKSELKEKYPDSSRRCY